jgi:hypothetical protein
LVKEDRLIKLRLAQSFKRRSEIQNSSRLLNIFNQREQFNTCKRLTDYMICAYTFSYLQISHIF